MDASKKTYFLLSNSLLRFLAVVSFSCFVTLFCYFLVLFLSKYIRMKKFPGTYKGYVVLIYKSSIYWKEHEISALLVLFFSVYISGLSFVISKVYFISFDIVIKYPPLVFLKIPFTELIKNLFRSLKVWTKFLENA